MGVYSTLDITRNDALKEIMGKILTADDSELEEILFTLFSEKTLNNFRIVNEYEFEDGYDSDGCRREYNGCF